MPLSFLDLTMEKTLDDHTSKLRNQLGKLISVENSFKNYVYSFTVTASNEDPSMNATLKKEIKEMVQNKKDIKHFREEMRKDYLKCEELRNQQQ